jgi:hypothetical protein
MVNNRLTHRVSAEIGEEACCSDSSRLNELTLPTYQRA